MKKGSSLNKKCTVEGCDKKHMAKGYCNEHYYRIKKYGRTHKLTTSDCFHEKYIVHPITNCWIWTASTRPSGYGQMGVGYKTCHAHRVSWKLHRGLIPKSLCVLHKCDTPACVNPEHLFLGTQKDNIQDAVKKGRLHGYNWQEDKIIKLKSLDPQKHTLQEFSDLLEVSLKSVRSKCRNLGIKGFKRNTKYTYEIIKPLWDKHNGKMNKVAKELNVHCAYIYKACKRLGLYP